MQLRLNYNNDLVLSIPGREGKRGHDVTIPTSVEGLRVIRQILLADRKERESGRAPCFATEAAPTQEMVKQYLRQHSPKVSVKIPARKTEELELDLTSLDLNF